MALKASDDKYLDRKADLQRMVANIGMNKLYKLPYDPLALHGCRGADWSSRSQPTGAKQ